MQTAGKLFGSAISPDWTDTVVSLLQPARSRQDSVLQKMVFQMVLYSIWREHNSRRHGGVWVTRLTTAKNSRSIDKLFRNRISSLCYARAHPLKGLMKRWFEVT
ncbi:hypothetical protein DY000_02041927 [Brassica cretica]|uniref:Uncharacterized protein n=1 Tax=Brassica cretica TaxID=69181 RepID=A0ABQ7BK05_BRACR|nr:hypothetical protein DY000_02041927 [Brassica cretica]